LRPHLLLAHLGNQTSVRDLEEALDHLPLTLDELYDSAMDRISGQVKPHKELAYLVLSWILNARRTLRLDEVQHALAVKPGDRAFNEDGVPPDSLITSVSAGLIAVHPESRKIGLVHFTVEEYFKKKKHIFFPDAEELIAMACIAYLSFDTFETGFYFTNAEFETQLPLYSYAAQNWGHHARATSKVKQLAVDFLMSETKISSYKRAMMVLGCYFGRIRDMGMEMTGVHLAAFFGLSQVMTALLGSGCDANVEDAEGRTPLSWAAENGYEDVIERLLATKVVDPDPWPDSSHQTPLWWAARKGHRGVVKRLLKEDDVFMHSEDSEFHRTPVSWAARNGDEAMTELFLENGLELSSEYLHGESPLILAAGEGHTAVLSLLLAKCTPGRDCQDALVVAVQKGHDSIVELLLTKDGIDPDFPDIFSGLSPLQLAASNGNKAVVAVLLENGARLDCEYNDDLKPLSLAAQNGHEEVVELLLTKYGVILNSKGIDDCQTALSESVIGGHTAVAKSLLAKYGVEKDSNIFNYQKMLSLAIVSRQEAIVEMLLDMEGVNPLCVSKDQYGWTLLSRAAQYGYEGVTKTLLAIEGVDPNSEDQNGRTPLSWAAGYGHEGVTKVLLATESVNPDSKDHTGRTPLSWAAENGREEATKLLLATEGVNPNCKDQNGRTPLSWAAERAHQGVTKLLLAKTGLDPESKDNSNLTPISRTPSLAVFELLLKKYRENSIALRTEDLSARQASIICDTCSAEIRDFEAYHHCDICVNGDFDICQKCIADGKSCQDGPHLLAERISKSHTYMTINEMAGESKSESDAEHPPVAEDGHHH